MRRIGERFDRADARIVACEYAGTIGVPALFERSLFPELLALSGTTGAKPVLEAHPTDPVAPTTRRRHRRSAGDRIAARRGR